MLPTTEAWRSGSNYGISDSQAAISEFNFVLPPRLQLRLPVPVERRRSFCGSSSPSALAT
jgi:hypothetical protein